MESCDLFDIGMRVLTLETVECSLARINRSIADIITEPRWTCQTCMFLGRSPAGGIATLFGRRCCCVVAL